MYFTILYSTAVYLVCSVTQEEDSLLGNTMYASILNFQISGNGARSGGSVLCRDTGYTGTKEDTGGHMGI